MEAGSWQILDIWNIWNGENTLSLITTLIFEYSAYFFMQLALIFVLPDHTQGLCASLPVAISMYTVYRDSYDATLKCILTCRCQNINL